MTSSLKLKSVLFLLFVMGLSLQSCSSDDDSNAGMDQEPESLISFIIDGEAVSLTNINVGVNGADSSIREITGTFPDGSDYSMRVSINVGATGTFTETLIQLDNTYSCSQSNSCNVNTNVTLHSDSRLQATFRYEFTNTNGDVLVTVTNGIMNLYF